MSSNRNQNKVSKEARCPHHSSGKCYVIPSMPSGCYPLLKEWQNYTDCNVYQKRAELSSEGWKFR